MAETSAPATLVPERAARFLRLAQQDISSSLELSASMDTDRTSLPEVLVTMTRLWDAQAAATMERRGAAARTALL